MIITFTARLAGVHWSDSGDAALLWHRYLTVSAESAFWSFHRGPFVIRPLFADDVVIAVSFGESPAIVSVGLDGIPDGTLGDSLVVNSFRTDWRQSTLADWVRNHPPQFGATARLATSPAQRARFCDWDPWNPAE